MADTEPTDPGSPGQRVRQGESTYAPDDMSEAARRSRVRETDHAGPAVPNDGTPADDNPLLGGADPARAAAAKQRPASET
jgi:hypothetical protein